MAMEDMKGGVERARWVPQKNVSDSKVSFMVAGFRSFELKLLLQLLIVSHVRVIP